MQLASENPFNTNNVYMETIMLTLSSDTHDSLHVTATLKKVTENGVGAAVWSQDIQTDSGNVVALHPHYMYPSFEEQYILAITSADGEALSLTFDCEAYTLFVPFPGYDEPNLVIASNSVGQVADKLKEMKKIPVDTSASMSGSYTGTGKVWVIKCSSTSNVNFTIDDGVVAILGSNTTVYMTINAANQTKFAVECIDGEDLVFGGGALPGFTSSPSMTMSWSGEAGPSSSLSTGAIVGIVIGCVAGVLLIVGGIFMYKKSGAKKGEESLHLQSAAH